MDWLFGRKKSEVKVDDAKEATQFVDGFVAYPPMPEHSFSGYPSLPNYNPTIPSMAATNVNPQPSSMYSLPATSHYSPPPSLNPLDSVPFKLSSRLETNNSHTMPSEVQRIGLFLSDVERLLNSSEYNYDFRLERSVLRETNVFNGI